MIHPAALMIKPGFNHHNRAHTFWKTSREIQNQFRRDVSVFATCEMQLRQFLQGADFIGWIEGVFERRNAVILGPGSMIQIACHSYQKNYIVAPSSSQGGNSASA